MNNLNGTHSVDISVKIMNDITSKNRLFSNKETEKIETLSLENDG